MTVIQDMSKEDPDQHKDDMSYYVNPDDAAQIIEGDFFLLKTSTEYVRMNIHKCQQHKIFLPSCL